MRKKFFIALLIGMAICASTLAAVKNPVNDDNLVLVYQHQGLENYLLKDSLRIHDSTLKRYKRVSFDFIIYDSIQPANTRWDNIQNMSFVYEEDGRRVYFPDENGELIYLDPKGMIAEGSGYTYGADLVYRLAFGKKFYVCPTYLDDDKNYILYADLGGQGAGLYVDRRSLNLIQEDDGGCLLSIDEVQVPDADKGSTQIANRYTHHYSYNIEKMVVMRFVDEEDRWIKVDPSVTNPEDKNFTYDATVAEMAYYLLLGEKFFGTFDEDFYKNLR